MSIQAVAWVLDHSQSKLGDRCVLIALANHADKYGFGARPGIKLLAAEANIHERTVPRCLENLIRIGEIEFTGEYANERGRPTKVWRIAKMPIPGNMPGYSDDETEPAKHSFYNRADCPVTAPTAVEPPITGQSERDNRALGAPKPGVGDIAYKGTEPSLNRPEADASSDADAEGLFGTAERCYQVMRELPACRNASGATAAHVAEVIADHPEVSEAEWIGFARWCRDKLIPMERYGGANTTWSESPSKVMREQLPKWAGKQRPDEKAAPEAAPATVTIDPDPQRAVDCEAFYPGADKWIPSNREYERSKGREVRELSGPPPQTVSNDLPVAERSDVRRGMGRAGKGRAS